MSSLKGKTHNAAVAQERLREVSSNVSKVVKKTALQEAEASGKSFIEQLLGLSLDKKTDKKNTHASEKQPSKGTGSGIIELFDSLTHKQSAESKPHSEKPRNEAAMNYTGEMARSSERASRAEVSEMSQNIQEIQHELKKLLASSKELSMEFAQVATEQKPVVVGNYHLNFFEWMLAVIRGARQKVENSGAWLNTVKGKGSKKGYWGMSQKHGTSFSMSNERSVATQVG